MSKNRIKTRVKICGIKEREDAFICLDQGAHALGFIFYSKTPRYILPKEAKKIIDSLPTFISKVGVFVNEKENTVREIASFVGLDTVQLHGAESSAFCKRLRKDFKVIKSFFPVNPKEGLDVSKYRVDGQLLDIPYQDKQKEPSLVLDKEILKRITKELDFCILSGGLSCDNVKELVKELRPYAVDVARGVERFPGKKDKSLVRKFIKQVESVKN